MEVAISQPKMVRLPRNKNKHNDWTLSLNCDHRIWPWLSPWPWICIDKFMMLKSTFMINIKFHHARNRGHSTKYAHCYFVFCHCAYISTILAIFLNIIPWALNCTTETTLTTVGQSIARINDVHTGKLNKTVCIFCRYILFYYVEFSSLPMTHSQILQLPLWSRIIRNTFHLGHQSASVRCHAVSWLGID